MEQEATSRLENRLDQQQYDEHQLITIKIPVTNLAYYNNSATFERATGDIEIGGTPYRYVKRRIFNDSLEMLCIPNLAALKLHELARTYFNLVNDIGQGPKHDSHPITSKSFSSDPFTCIQPVQVDAPQCRILTAHNHFLAPLSSLSISSDERPPVRIAG